MARSEICTICEMSINHSSSCSRLFRYSILTILTIRLKEALYNYYEIGDTKTMSLMQGTRTPSLVKNSRHLAQRTSMHSTLASPESNWTPSAPLPSFPLPSRNSNSRNPTQCHCWWADHPEQEVPAPADHPEALPAVLQATAAQPPAHHKSPKPANSATKSPHQIPNRQYESTTDTDSHTATSPPQP